MSNLRLHLGIAAGAMTTISLLSPSAASASGSAPCDPNAVTAVASCTIVYDSVTYLISSITATFSSAFPSPTTDSLLWWGDELKASSFAAAVGTALGYPNLGYGPLFSWKREPNTYSAGQDGIYSRTRYTPCTGTCLTTYITRATSYEAIGGGTVYPDFSYAKSEVYLPSVPGPLPALGVAAAFGYSRKMRKRIKSSANTDSSVLKS